MKSLLKAFVISAALVCGVVSSALASDWTYANNQITEVLPEGSGRRTPWILRTVVREDGALTVGNENGSSFNNAPVQTGDSGGMIDLSGTVSDGTTTYAIKGIGTAAFRTNTAVTGLKLPTGFDKINTAAFYGCSNLATVEPFLPDTLTYLGWAAFRCCGKLKCDLVLSNPALSMGSGASWNDGTFYQSGITSADLSAVTLESLPKQGFRESGVTWVKLPKGLMNFTDATFFGCKSLANIEFNSFPSSIGGDVFQNGLAMPNSRFTYPATSFDWDTFVRSASFKPWADAGSANQQTYETKFPDGPQPIGYCTIGGSVKWAVPIAQAVTERRLSILGVLTTGAPYNVGTVTPDYHKSEVVEDATLECSAPSFAVDGTYGYRCVGYRIGKLAEAGFVYGDLVESTSCTFVESEPGEYVLQWCWEKTACKVSVAFPEALGTVRISSDFYQGFTDYFAFGDTVTVTATATNGAPFEAWFGDVPEADEPNNPLTLTVDAPKTVVPYFAAKWALNAAGNSVSDGYWTFPVSGTRDALTVKSPTAAGLAKTLDFAKGIEDGGSFAAVASMLFYNNSYGSGVKYLRLPDSMTAIADNAFRECANLLTVRVSPDLVSLGTASFCECKKLKSFEPFTFPKLTFLGWAAFRNCENLHQDLVLNNRNLRLGVNSDWDWGQFYRSGITSADLSAATMSDLSYQTFRECRQMTVVKFPKGLLKLNATCPYASALRDIQFQSFPTNFAKSTDSFLDTPSYGRIVYPKGEAGWEAYIAEQKDGGNFTAWDPESARAKEYLAAFPDQWRPIGYMTIDGNKRWLVPHNFNVGTMVLVR